jgi:hypothetical protein
MRKFKILATTGWVVAAIALGMTATSWASAGGAPVGGSGAGAPGAPHASVVLRPLQVDAVFRAIAPCRIVDTRLKGGPIGNQQSRTYFVGGTTGFTPQGGKNGGCGIPVGATAIAASLTAPTPTGLGAIRAWPNGSAEPIATVLSYSQNITASSGATLSIATSPGAALRIKNYRGPTNLFIDVTGYYAQQIEARVNADGTLASATSRILSVSKTGTGRYAITVDVDVSQCSITVTPYATNGMFVSASETEGTKARVDLSNLPTSTATPADGPFYVQIAC